MAISTYSDLVTAVSNWSTRSDVVDEIPGFISLATSMFNIGIDGVKAIRTREMETVATLTPVATAYALPSNYLQYRRVVELRDNRRELKFIAPSYADQRYPQRPAGLPNDFTIIGSNLYAFPTTTNNIELTYYQAIPDLTDSNTTNWLLTKAPHLYLHGALFQLAMFIRDDALMAREQSILVAAIGGLDNTDEVSVYARASVKMGGIRP